MWPVGVYLEGVGQRDAGRARCGCRRGVGAGTGSGRGLRHSRAESVSSYPVEPVIRFLSYSDFSSTNSNAPAPTASSSASSPSAPTTALQPSKPCPSSRSGAPRCHTEPPVRKRRWARRASRPSSGTRTVAARTALGMLTRRLSSRCPSPAAVAAAWRVQLLTMVPRTVRTVAATVDGPTVFDMYGLTATVA